MSLSTRAARKTPKGKETRMRRGPVEVMGGGVFFVQERLC
jgi:hypothetical protein